MDLLNKENKRKLNSLTKFPHMPPRHVMGKKELTEEVTSLGLLMANEELTITEKFDGANVRIIYLPDGRILIGSRNDLLTCLGDLVWDESYEIVEALTPIAHRAAQWARSKSSFWTITVLYGELYGVKHLQEWKNYGDGYPKFRLFDIAQFSTQRLEEPIERIAAWRERGEQAWFGERDLQEAALHMLLPLTTRLGTVALVDLPTSIEETREWMEDFRVTSELYLPEDSPALSEGVVLSDRLRTTRIKLRFPDYDKVLNRRKEEIRLAEKAARAQKGHARWATGSANR